MNAFARRSLLALIPLALALSLLSCRAADQAEAGVRVMLLSGSDFTVAGANPMHVPHGEDAVFHIEKSPEAVVCSVPRNAVWDEAASTLTVPAVRYPTTLSLIIKVNPTLYKFYLEPLSGGKVSADTEQGWVLSGTQVTVTATPREGYRFVGWSLNRSIEKGGAVLGTDLTLTHTVEGESFLYANFTSAKGGGAAGGNVNTKNPPASSKKGSIPSAEGKERLRILYHGNGGIYAQSGAEVHETNPTVYFTYENSLPDKGYFTREGYQLLGYARDAAGTDRFITPGSKIIADKSEEPIHLYCIWAKENPESDFTWEIADGAATVTGYSGTGDTLVIPDTLGGMPVLRIGAGAVAGSFSTLVLPECIRTVDDGAFITTPALETIYMRDTVTKMTDKAFTDLSGWKNLRLIASHTPYYTTQTGGNFYLKWERLVSAKRAGKKVLVVVSGSSSFYGLSTEQMEKYLKNEYTVVNYGTNAGTSSAAYLEMISHYVGEGDIIIHAPELNAATLGKNEITYKFLSHLECYYNFFEGIDMRRFPKFFSSLTELNKYRKDADKKGYTYNHLNENTTLYGEHTSSWNFNPDTYHAGSNFTMEVGKISGTNRKNLNFAYQLLLDTGATVYMSCAPCNYNAVKPQYRSIEAQDKYMASVRESVIVPVISHIADYVMEPKYMYNSDYHVNLNGCAIRTERLYTDLCVQLRRDGIPVP